MTIVEMIISRAKSWWGTCTSWVQKEKAGNNVKGKKLNQDSKSGVYFKNNQVLRDQIACVHRIWQYGEVARGVLVNNRIGNQMESVKDSLKKRHRDSDY